MVGTNVPSWTSREEYVKAWKEHSRELSGLRWNLDTVQSAELTGLQDRLNALIEKAATNLDASRARTIAHKGRCTLARDGDEDVLTLSSGAVIRSKTPARKSGAKRSGNVDAGREVPMFSCETDYTADD